MAANYYYTIIFALSFLLTLIYVFQWHRRIDVSMTLIFMLIPIANLAYMLMHCQQNPEAAIVALKFLYVGGCFLPWLATMCLANLCGIKVNRNIRAATFMLSAAMLLSVLTIGHSPYFYAGFSMVRNGTTYAFQKTYGPLHAVFYACVALFTISNVILIVYVFFKKRQVSRRILFLLFIPILATVIGYLVNHYTEQYGYEIMPALYVLDQIVYLLIARRMALYDAGEMVIESMVQSGDTGFITFDSRRRYLGSNDTAKRIIPALRELTVDRSIRDVEALRSSVLPWLDHFDADEHAGKELYVRKQLEEGAEEAIYTVRVSHLTEGRRRIGYQIFLEDDTPVQKYIQLMDNYNFKLEREVAEKTERVVAMHDRLILGMATMVESRDNSTGGHIRRTSEGVRILIEEMRKDPAFPLSEAFCRDIIKAAPMHDLGKIAVDDAILRKPGRFTPEEFEKMKAHAAEGARIVHEILRETDDDEFRRIAENVAHYHHERMDGCGYPEGLRGDAIPLEARIMAIADVYDALVSKRVYKEKFTFEKADRIIMEEMGQHFDERLKPYYEAARPRLEAYYLADAGE